MTFPHQHLYYSFQNGITANWHWKIFDCLNWKWYNQLLSVIFDSKIKIDTAVPRIIMNGKNQKIGCITYHIHAAMALKTDFVFVSSTIVFCSRTIINMAVSGDITTTVFNHHFWSKTNVTVLLTVLQFSISTSAG